MPRESGYRDPREAGLVIEEEITPATPDKKPVVEARPATESKVEGGGLVMDMEETESAPPAELDPKIEATIVELKQKASERQQQILEVVAEAEKAMAGWSDPTAPVNMKKFVEQHSRILNKIKELVLKKDGQITLNDGFAKEANSIIQDIGRVAKRVIDYENSSSDKKADPMERARIAKLITSESSVGAASRINGPPEELGDNYFEFRGSFEDVAKRKLKMKK